MLTPAERVVYLEGFYRALHDFWRCQQRLGSAVSDKAPVEVVKKLDLDMKQAMDRLGGIDITLQQDNLQRGGGG